MSEMIERLARCERVTEWVSLFDERLVRATGRPSPNSGGSLRENWDDVSSPIRLEAEIARLLIPAHVELEREVTVRFQETEQQGFVTSRVLLNFCSKTDWLKCFPLGESSRLPNSDEDWHAWAGLAVCGEVIGLAVFAEELLEFEDMCDILPVQARVQPVPMEVFGRIIG